MLVAALGSACRKIEHIGSTSVAGMAAKPIVDIAVLVPSVALVKEFVKPLAELSYEYMGEFNLPGRHFFTKRGAHQFNLHIVDEGSDHWQRWLKFRDISRADANVRREYMELKRSLVARFADDRASYTAGKSEFVNRVISSGGCGR